MAWPLLNALNQAEITATTLESENQLLKDYIEKLEQELSILTGKKIPLFIGNLVSILNPLVTSESVVQQAAQLVADLGETEYLQTRRNIQAVEEALVLPVIKTKKPVV